MHMCGARVTVAILLIARSQPLLATSAFASDSAAAAAAAPYMPEDPITLSPLYPSMATHTVESAEDILQVAPRACTAATNHAGACMILVVCCHAGRHACMRLHAHTVQAQAAVLPATPSCRSQSEPHAERPCILHVRPWPSIHVAS